MWTTYTNMYPCKPALHVCRKNIWDVLKSYNFQDASVDTAWPSEQPGVKRVCPFQRWHN